MLAKDDISYFIDGHSMSALGPMIGPDNGKPRPAFTFITCGDSQGNKVEGHHTSVTAEQAQQLREKLELHFKDIMRDSDVPDSILINDPFALGGTTQRLSDPNSKNAKPGFALEFNKALYLEQDATVKERPIPNRVSALNKRFQAFVSDCDELFQALV